MNNDLNFLIKCPSKEQIRENLPKCFKHFKTTRCILDCIKFFVQKPSLPSVQRITYSYYKHHNTFKCLVALTPSGSVSDLYTGSISDKKIVQESGFLDNIEFGDDVMTGPGFLIRGDLALNIPHSLLENRWITMQPLDQEGSLGLERAMGRLKNYAMLQGVIALQMKPLYNKIV